MIKTILFARVSSREQEETGYSLPAQVRFLKEYQQTVSTSLGGSHLCSYERYEADSVADALAFLETKNVSQAFRYVEVVTPDGLVGKDVEGVYKI